MAAAPYASVPGPRDLDSVEELIRVRDELLAFTRICTPEDLHYVHQTNGSFDFAERLERVKEGTATFMSENDIDNYDTNFQPNYQRAGLFLSLCRVDKTDEPEYKRWFEQKLDSAAAHSPREIIRLCLTSGTKLYVVDSLDALDCLYNHFKLADGRFHSMHAMVWLIKNGYHGIEILLNHVDVGAPDFGDYSGVNSDSDDNEPNDFEMNIDLPSHPSHRLGSLSPLDIKMTMIFDVDRVARVARIDDSEMGS